MLVKLKRPHLVQLICDGKSTELVGVIRQIWLSHFYWGTLVGAPSLSVKLLRVSSATPSLGSGGPEGGWVGQACSHPFRPALGSCSI